MKGRPKGSPNKDKQALIEKAYELGVDPFVILCEYALDKTDHERRFSAAKELCQYLYPKRSSVKLSADEESGFKIIIEDYQAKANK